MKSYPFTPDMKRLPVEQLFDCMAAKLVEFAHECGQDPNAQVCTHECAGSRILSIEHQPQLWNTTCPTCQLCLRWHINSALAQGKDTPIVGFCFSFPVDQLTVNSGRIIVWTKGAVLATLQDCVSDAPQQLMVHLRRQQRSS